jgi:TatA/E family protein of Tat protein translocase
LLTSILQPTHLILILAVALLVLGPKRLPEAGRSLGQGLKEFRASIGGHESLGGHDSVEGHESLGGHDGVEGHGRDESAMPRGTKEPG